MRNGLRPQPARLVRGSSRRIMAMRFRPANIRVINRRVSSSAVTGPIVQTQIAQGSPAGMCSRYAARRSCRSMPERCSTARVRYAAPNTGAPLPSPRRSGQLRLATGGSGGNTSRPASTEKAGPPPSRGQTGQGFKPVSPEGLTRSLHIRTATCCRRTRISKVSSTRERNRTRIPAEGQNKSDRRPRFSTRHRTQPGGDRPTQAVEIGQLHSIGYEQYPIRRNRGAALHGTTLVMHRGAFSGTPPRRLYPGLS